MNDYALAQKTLRRLRSIIAKQRHDERKRRGIRPNQMKREDWQRERAIVRRLALTQAVETKNVSTMSVLIAMWELYATGDWLRTGEETSFAEYLDVVPDAHGEMLGMHLEEDYRAAFVNVIERLLAYVNAVLVYTPAGERITPRLLIERAKPGKLKLLSWRVAAQDNPQVKHQYLIDLVTMKGSAADLRSRWDKAAAGDESTPGNGDTTVSTVNLPDYKVAYLPNGRVRVDWNCEMDEKQFRVFESAMGAVARSRLA